MDKTNELKCGIFFSCNVERKVIEFLQPSNRRSFCIVSALCYRDRKYTTQQSEYEYDFIIVVMCTLCKMNKMFQQWSDITRQTLLVINT